MRENMNKKMKNVIDYKKIISMMEENPSVINNDKSERIIGLVEFNTPNKGLACMFNSRYYSLNLCYIDEDDNKLHCSQMSIGGVLWRDKDLAQQIKEYNNDVVFGSKIVCCHMADGATVYPAK